MRLKRWDLIAGMLFEDQEICQESIRGFPYRQATVSPDETPRVEGSADFHEYESQSGELCG